MGDAEPWRRLGPWTYRRLVDRLKAADPGALRLIMATRAVLSAGLSALLLAGAGELIGRSPLIVLSGVFVAMMSSITVNDPTPSAQRRTLLLLPLPVGAAFVAAALSAPVNWLSHGLMLVVIFLGVLARRFGPRGHALGILSFLLFYLPAYFSPPLSTVPAGLLGCVTGAATAYLVRFVVLRDAPAFALRFSVMAIRARAALVLGDAARCLAHGRPAPGSGMINRWSSRSHRQLRRDLILLRDAALLLASQLGDGDPARALNHQVFQLEFTLEHLVMVAQDAEGPKRHLARALVQLGAAIRLREVPGGVLAAWRSALAQGCKDSAQRAKLDADAAALLDYAAHDVSLARAAAPASRMPVIPAQPKAAAAWIQALQTVTACGLAMALGHLVSPMRWQWAVIAAFVIFAKSSTMAETMVRAWQRSTGTLVGVALAIVVAASISGHHYLELGLVFACLFFAYYSMGISYAWMAVLITGMLALLYVMLGTYSPQLLVLRLEETLAGALCGAVVAVLVMPISFGGALRARTAEALRAVAQFLECPPTADPEASSRELDHKLQAARNIVRSLDESLLASLVPRVVTALDALATIVYEARRQVLSAAAKAPASPADVAAVVSALNAVATRIERPSKDRPGGETESGILAPEEASGGLVRHGLGRILRETAALQRCFISPP